MCSKGKPMRVKSYSSGIHRYYNHCRSRNIHFFICWFIHSIEEVTQAGLFLDFEITSKTRSQLKFSTFKLAIWAWFIWPIRAKVKSQVFFYRLWPLTWNFFPTLTTGTLRNGDYGCILGPIVAILRPLTHKSQMNRPQNSLFEIGRFKFS